MKKVPLESTIVGSYKFLFQNIGSIVGTMWFPVLALLAVFCAFLYGILPHNFLHGDFTPPADADAFMRARLPLFVLAIPCLFISALLVGAMIRTGILRHALEEKTTTTFIWFSLGARVWRMVVVTLLYVVIYIGLELAVLAVVGLSNLIMAAIPHVPYIVVGLVNAVLVVAGLLTGIYVMVRLFFFLPAVVVAENKIGLEKAWRLGKGNVWRIIAVLIVVAVPVVAIAGIILYVTALTTIVSVAASGHEPQTPQEVFALLKLLLPAVPVIVGVYVIAAIGLSGLVLGAIGKAYKALTAPEETAA